MTRSVLEAVVVANHKTFMLTSDGMEAALAEHGLTHATAQALWMIDPHEPPPSMKVMANRLFCNAPNLSFVTNQLVDRGFVERSVDPDDRRSRVLTLTGSGRRVRATVIAAMLAISPFARLSPEELLRLKELLEKACADR